MRFTCYVSDSDSEECYDDSVISATSTLCSLSEGANDDANHPTINVEAEPEAKHGPQRAPLLLPAPTHTPADESLGEECKALVIYNLSHEQVPLEEEGRASVTNDSNDHGSENTPQSDLQVDLYSTTSQAWKSPSAGADDDQSSPSLPAKSDSEASPNDNLQRVSCTAPPCSRIRNEEKRAEAIPMKRKDECLVLWDFSRSGGTVVKVETDDDSARPSKDENEPEDSDDAALNDALAPVQEDNKDKDGEVHEQIGLHDAKAEAAPVCAFEPGQPVEYQYTYESDQRHEQANRSEPESNSESNPSAGGSQQEPSPENASEAGGHLNPNPHAYPYPAACPEQEPSMERMSHGYEYTCIPEACQYTYPVLAPVTIPLPAPEPQLVPSSYGTNYVHKPKRPKDKRRLAREVRREVHLRRQQVKRVLRKHRKARKTLRDAVEANWADSLERSYNRWGWEDDVVPMDVDEGYDAGSFKEGERSAMPGLSHRHARQAHTQAKDKQNEEKFSRQSLFANRSWYCMHKVMQVFTHNQLDLLLPWLALWDGTRPNQRNWLMRSLWKETWCEIGLPTDVQHMYEMYIPPITIASFPCDFLRC